MTRVCLADKLKGLTDCVDCVSSRTQPAKKGKFKMSSTINATVNNATTITIGGYIGGYGVENKPFYLGQVLRADLDIGETDDGSRIGKPGLPGLVVEGVGYREFFYPETGLRCQDLAGVVTRIPDWGFKTPIQFQVAKRLAKYFGHLWAQPTMITVRKPQPNGAIKLVEEPVEPANPWEAATWANNKYDRDAMYWKPTPKWESGTSTFKVEVFPSGEYTIIVNGMVAIRFNPDGKVLSFKLMPNWITSWCGRATTGNEAIVMAVEGSQPWLGSSDVIEMFEGDKQFWRTGFVPGTRWCTYERGGSLGYGGVVIDLHNA